MGTRIPTVILTTPTGMEICPDGSDIRLTQFDCKWKDDGKDDIELTFESRNVQLMHSWGFVYEGLVSMSFGYTDGNMSDVIPYVIKDVERKYTEKGLSTTISLTSLSSPLDSLSVDDDSPIDVEIPDEEGSQEENESKTISQSPLEFIIGLMGDSLELIITCRGKVGYRYSRVKAGNGYIPPTFSWNSYNVVKYLLPSPITGNDAPIYIGPFRDNSILEEAQQGFKPKASDIDLPDELKEFLLTPRIIDVTAKKVMATINKILSYMPEGPWYVTRRGNLFMIHDRGIFGSAKRQFNFYNDDNTILSCTIKYDGDELSKDKEEVSSQDSTLRNISRVVQYNTALKTMEEIWDRVINNNPKVIQNKSSVYVQTDSIYGLTNDVFGGDKTKNTPDLIKEGMVINTRQGLLLKQNLKYTLDGLEISKEDYDKFNEAYATAKELHKYAGIEKLYQYYLGESGDPYYYTGGDQSGVTTSVVDSDKAKSSFMKVLEQMSYGASHGNAGSNARLPNSEIVRVKHEKFYVYDPIDDKTGRVRKFSGVIRYIQTQENDDAIWEAANRLGASAMAGVTGTCTIEGEPSIMDGMVVRLTGLGGDSGDYYVKAVRHSITESGGYKTTMELCRQAEETTATMLNQVREYTSYKPEDLRRRFFDQQLFGVNNRQIFIGPSNPRNWSKDASQTPMGPNDTPTDDTVWVSETGDNYMTPNSPEFQNEYVKQAGIDE